MRRKRFTVTLIDTDGTERREVVLAYSADGARGIYANRDVVVAAVATGDYRKQAAIELMKADDSRGFEVDWNALAQAIADLDLQLSVRIKQTAAYGSQLGAHRLKSRRAVGAVADSLVHHITVKRWLTAEEASRVLWHELAHAQQAEQAIDDLSIEKQTGLRRWHDACARYKHLAYEVKPFEIAARRMEDRADELALAVSA